MVYLFVYGTLLDGCGNHHRLAASRLIADAMTKPVFTMLDFGGFPAIVPGGSTSIKGEIYEVGAAALADIDRLEGHPNFYERKRIELVSTTMRHRTANLVQWWTEVQAYVLSRPAPRARVIIESGSWRERVR